MKTGRILESICPKKLNKLHVFIIFSEICSNCFQKHFFFFCLHYFPFLFVLEAGIKFMLRIRRGGQSWSPMPPFSFLQIMEIPHCLYRWKYHFCKLLICLNHFYWMIKALDFSLTDIIQD